MDLKTAATVRVSRREYIDEPMQTVTVDALQAEIDRLNALSGLHMRLVTDDSAIFARSFGLFSGVRNAVLLSGDGSDADLFEKCGYYGEMLVLFATTLNLGTCWVAGTFSRAACEKMISPQDALAGVIAIGPVKESMSARESVKYRLIHRGSKSIEDMCAFDQREDWFGEGMALVVKAPSARNRQSVFFTLKAGAVSARIEPQKDKDKIDLGIAKLHFELGAGGGRWQWGSGGQFLRD